MDERMKKKAEERGRKEDGLKKRKGNKTIMNQKKTQFFLTVFYIIFIIM